MLATSAPSVATSAQSSLPDALLPTNAALLSSAPAATTTGGPIVRQSILSIHNTPTTLVLMSYSDRTVVLVSQLDGRVGTLIQVESVSPTSSTPGDTTADAADSRSHLLDQRLLGAESPMHSVYATEIAHVVSKCGVVMPVLVGLGLKRLVSNEDDQHQEDLEREMVRLKEVVAGVEAMIRRGA
ncbi:hypothetical protein BCR44DRAFT_1434324 [Catenaria anguillulae PL171]|uniref:Uncharacterized protein n=1 Tax=Catenaria anguillulae PL171 TaxID=765915 RepID=A0A1Y2HLN2_9FUNG|nr:hypothetical protein BCR44DRAFT_1434324 [Catenaria anguillulae PL171]